MVYNRLNTDAMIVGVGKVEQCGGDGDGSRSVGGLHRRRTSLAGSGGGGRGRSLPALPGRRRPPLVARPRPACSRLVPLLLDLSSPVENVVVCEALTVEQIAEKLTKVRVVGLVVKAEGAAEIQIRGKFPCAYKKTRVLDPPMQ